MTEALPAFCDDVEIECDMVEVHRFYIVVRNRAGGAEHSFAYDGITIGSSASGNCYVLTMPAWLAAMEGIVDAR
jgi:hypothetical protein